MGERLSNVAEDDGSKVGLGWHGRTIIRMVVRREHCLAEIEEKARKERGIEPTSKDMCISVCERRA